MFCTHWWGMGWFWIIPPLVMILMFIISARMIRRTGGWRWCSGNRAGWGSFCGWRPDQDSRRRWWSDRPSQILDLRYATGEITKEQYERMRGDIESSPSR